MKYNFMFKKISVRTIAAVLALTAAASCGKDNITPETPDNGGNGGDEENTGRPEVVDETPFLPAPQLRGAWMATVWGIDWPSGDYSQSGQKKLYTDYLDLYKSLGINAVFFQVRGMADAFHESSYEPWSRYITGSLGKNPGYDILRFLIDEAHKRGIKFHAWMNPYRVATTSYFSDGLNSMIPESMVKKYSGIWVYNPALPEVRQRIADIVKELISKYNVDGIHFDDYFYPSGSAIGSGLDDQEDYNKYGCGYSNIQDFRRGNIFEMVKLVRNTILSVNPEIAFTIGPQGNYDNNYNSQYIDVAKVCSAGLIDAVIPQLYWSTKAATDYYTPRLNWWAQNISSTPLMIGHTLSGYSTDEAGKGWSSGTEFETQCTLAAAKNVAGHLIYNSSTLKKNPKSVQTNIKNAFKEKVLIPHLGGTSADAPVPAPENVVVSGGELHWDKVDAAAYYAVYLSNGDKRTATLLDVTTELSYPLPDQGNYFVTALNEHNAQSAASGVLKY